MMDTQSSDDSTKEDGEVQVFQMLTNIFSRVGSNDLTSLKEYLDSNKGDLSKYTKSVEYTYNVVPQIYSANTESIRQVNPDRSFAALGLRASSTSNSTMSSMMSTNVFYQMPQNTDLYQEQFLLFLDFHHYQLTVSYKLDHLFYHDKYYN